MGGTRVACVMRTNVKCNDIPDDFLERASDCLKELFDTTIKNVVLELHTSILMARGGSTSPMMNIDVRHNSDDVKTSKVTLASNMADFVERHISGISSNRTLVLFFDTRKCC